MENKPVHQASSKASGRSTRDTQQAVTKLCNDNSDSTGHSTRILLPMQLRSPQWRCTEPHKINDIILAKTTVAPAVIETMTYDIVGIVMDVIVDFSTRDSVQLLITDQSMSNPLSCARIWLFGESGVSSILKRGVDKFDVIRINSLENRKSGPDKTNINRKNDNSPRRSVTNNGSKCIVCELQHSYHDPEPSNLFWTRLCSIRCTSAETKIIFKEDPIPENMSTPTTRIQNLVDWFINDSGGEKMMINCRSSRAFIPSLQSQARSICRIKSTNLMSDVIVRVLSFDISPARKRAYGNVKKKNRYNYSPNRLRESSIIATISDGCGESDIIALHECKLSWKETLEKSIKNKEYLKITNLLSSSVDSTYHHGGDVIILLPTKESLLLPIDIDKIGHTNNNDYCNGTQTQVHENEQSFSLVPPNDIGDKKTITIFASVIGIGFGDTDVSIGRGHFPNADQLAYTLVEAIPSESFGGRRGYSYRCAKVTLKNSCNGCLLVARANRSIVQTLCGGVSASKILQQTTLRDHVWDLLQSFLHDDGVKLEWTLHVARRQHKDYSDIEQSFTILNVRLPRIC